MYLKKENNINEKFFASYQLTLFQKRTLTVTCVRKYTGEVDVNSIFQTLWCFYWFSSSASGDVIDVIMQRCDAQTLLCKYCTEASVELVSY